jgi:hypothetical protein
MGDRGTRRGATFFKISMREKSATAPGTLGTFSLFSHDH